MSKKEEILHKLNTEDRNYIKEKFKEKDAKIQQLEYRLSNCIEPKYNAGQEVWHLLCENGVAKDVIEENYNVYSLKISRLGGLYEDLLFATEEEAKAKLREIQDVKD